MREHMQHIVIRFFRPGHERSLPLIVKRFSREKNGFNVAFSSLIPALSYTAAAKKYSTLAEVQ